MYRLSRIEAVASGTGANFFAGRSLGRPGKRPEGRDAGFEEEVP